ncbi:hypothetical protein KCQ_20169 [Pectobacterium atrosepticum ICMP 1526]|nr:hypothetical protein KCQ_20169 [Pectobacterium atrosepticum ICMP 1526]
MIPLTVITYIKTLPVQNNKTKYNFIFHKNYQPTDFIKNEKNIII